jgi:uncharacterized membrane protein
MTAPHLHLILTHAPIFVSAIGLFGLIVALMRRSDELQWASYWLLVGAALVAIPVFLSGEASEEVIERLPGVSEALIDAHATAAKVSLFGSEVLGVLALTNLTLARRTLRSAIATGTALFVGALVMLSFTYTANLGGQIRHSEIRTVNQSAQQTSLAGPSTP